MIPRQSLPEPVLALAARQDGVLATRQLLRAGVTPDVLSRLGGQWQRPAQGLYLLGPATWGAAAHAGLLRVGRRRCSGSMPPPICTARSATPRGR